MDLTTRYLGLTLRTPLVPSASAPLTETIDRVKQLEDAGASAIVLHSLFEEQLRQDRLALHHHTTHGTESFPEALTYFPDPDMFHVGPETYLNHIRAAKEMVSVPVIASLNGSTVGGWTSFAKQIEQAGADALELNVYSVPTDIDRPGDAIEQEYVDILRSVKSAVQIPVAVKLSPFFSNTGNMAKRLADAGANGLVLFNRFYQPDINIDALEVRPNLLLSTPQSMRLPLRWIAMLYGQIEVDFAATSGIHRGRDAIAMLMAGASVTMLCSVLMRHGIDRIRVIEREMREWMEQHEYISVQQMQGTMSQKYCPAPDQFERAQYTHALQTFQPGWANEPSHFFG
ncbi:MAG: dihydroorotate dehydrogenase-like protein [Cyanobacteria bacterium J06639_1]